MCGGVGRREESKCINRGRLLKEWDEMRHRRFELRNMLEVNEWMNEWRNKENEENGDLWERKRGKNLWMWGGWRKYHKNKDKTICVMWIKRGKDLQGFSDYQKDHWESMKWRCCLKTKWQDEEWKNKNNKRLQSCEVVE